MKKILFATAICAGLMTLPAMAKDKVTTHQVHFDKGTTGTTVKGEVKGYDTVNYKLSAKKGQHMRVNIKSKHANFNIYAPGKGLGDEALFVGEPGIPYKGNLSKDGTYTISVYLMRNEARRGTNTTYSLSVGID
ncbi:putative hypothetical Gifsy-1 prophage protein [hydrothermal vent metagenome]|uniref:Putative hypothetical Gifsy-1 prophage protein n=1 Tax=hydrothermal vent metagenome TaxID=652676 RepID=A0A1W1EE52_9ZZZZ